MRVADDLSPAGHAGVFKCLHPPIIDVISGCERTAHHAARIQGHWRCALHLFVVLDLQ